MTDKPLVRYDAMCRAIDAAYEVDEAKDIRDKALAMEVYARQAMNFESENRAKEIRIRAERKVGQLLKEMTKAKGAPGNQYTGKMDRSNDTTGPKTLHELGITKDQSSQWQQLADVPDELFEAALADPTNKPSTHAIVAAANPMDAATTAQIRAEFAKVSDDAWCLASQLRAFEHWGLLDKNPAEIMSTMTDTMLDDVHRLAPLVANWLKRIGGMQ